MLMSRFLYDDSGAVSVDWVVLTAALVGTGLAVVSTVSEGVERLSNDLGSNMRGQIIRATFTQDLCEGGLHQLQRREDARVASAVAQGDDPQAIDVEQWMLMAHGTAEDADLLSDYQDALADLPEGGQWGRANTLIGTMECALVKRGLL